MNMTGVRAIAALLLLAAGSLPATRATPTAAKAAKPLPARVAPGLYHLGSLIPLEIEAPLDTPAFYLEGDLVEGADWGSARVSAVRAIPPDTFPGVLRIQAQIQVFVTGTIHLPPLPLTLRAGELKQAYTLTVPDFAVAALLPPGEQPEPPAAAPLPLPSAFPWGWVVLGLALLAAALLAVLWFLRTRSRRPTRAVAMLDLRVTDPDRWIRDELERLYRAPVAPQIRFATISQRLRDYLEIKSGLPFLEWTTSEVQVGIRRLGHLRGESPADLLAVLALCDWVCFARYTPEQTEVEESRERALRFVGAVAATPPPQEGAA